jgi:PAS domain S-box-containing protein
VLSPAHGDVAMMPGEFMALVLEAVPHPVWVVDEAERIIYANPVAAAAVGHDGAELRGKPSHETVHFKRIDGSHYPREECPMLRPRETGEVMHGEEEWFVRRDGSMFPIEWWSAPIEIPAGDGVRGRGAIFSFNDISERLAAQEALRARELAEVRAAESRAAQRRIVEQTSAVRRQVASDLHDGAQQRLVSLLIDLRLARDDLATDPLSTRDLLGSAVEQAQAAIEELRAFAAGIHPAVLSTRGLSAAIEALATNAAVPVTVSGDAPRLPEAIEANAYYFAAEAVTNAAKHASATHVDVTIEADDRRLSIEVHDDGVGGAVIGGKSGRGLASMADRIDALDGRLVLDSPPGMGTAVRAEIALGAAAG